MIFRICTITAGTETASASTVSCVRAATPIPRNPARIGAYLRHAAGWTSNLTNITPGASVSLAADRNEFGLLRKNRTEYFIIENREKTGRDIGLPDAGLAIWKVDETGDNSDEAMTENSHYECSLIQADGRNELEKGLNNGNDGDLFDQGATFSDTTKPNSKWWDGSSSELKISQVTAPGPTITFTT